MTTRYLRSAPPAALMTRPPEVAGPVVERWAAAVGAENGFTGITHTVEVFGTCGECSHAGAAS